MSIGSRIKEIRERLKLRQKSFAQAIGVSQGNLSEIESGKFTPSVDTIISISRYTKVSTDWLLTGKEYDIDTLLDPDLKMLTEAYKLMDKNNQYALKSYAGLLLTHKNLDVLEEVLNKTRGPDPDQQAEVIKEEQKVYLPVLGTAAAGMPIMADEMVEGFIPVPVTKVQKNTFALRAKGESMIDAGINDGDLVLIHQQPMVEQGEIALVKVDDNVTIKKFYRYEHKIRLKSANNAIRDIVVTDMAKIRVIGKVIGVVPGKEANLTMRHEFNGDN